MRRRALIRHLRLNRCVLLREGANHSVWVNPANRKVTTVPRHHEINEYLVQKICRDLEIPAPQ